MKIIIKEGIAILGEGEYTIKNGILKSNDSHLLWSAIPKEAFQEVLGINIEELPQSALEIVDYANEIGLELQLETEGLFDGQYMMGPNGLIDEHDELISSEDVVLLISSISKST